MTIVFTANRIHSHAGKVFTLLTLIGVLYAALAFTGCASSPDAKSENPKEALTAVEKQWGIKVESINITAAGHLVDFRYRVIDPEKATPLMKRGAEVYIIDQATGMKMPVPMTKVGPLRGTGTAPKADRVYAVMFTSGGRTIKKGSQVTVVIGDFKVENLVVE